MKSVTLAALGTLAYIAVGCGHVGSSNFSDFDSDFPGVFSRNAFKEKKQEPIINTYVPKDIDSENEIIDAFSKENFLEMKESLKEKKLALALITADYDTNNVTNGIEQTFQDNFKNIEQYKLLTKRVKNYDDFFNSLRDYSQLKSIDALILVMHGNEEDIAISKDERIATYNAERLLKNYSKTISEDGIILLYSCDAGKENGVAEKISDATKRDVQAFRYTYFPENYLTKEKRAGEFITDSTGRLSLNIGALKLYESINNNGYEYCPAIGTTGFKNFNGENKETASSESVITMISK